jgi:hypothetical protein
MHRPFQRVFRAAHRSVVHMPPAKEPAMTPAGRLLAILIAVVAIAALGAQGVVSQHLLPNAGTAAVIWVMAAYFTVLTNALVAATFVWTVISGRTGPAG